MKCDWGSYDDDNNFTPCEYEAVWHYYDSYKGQDESAHFCADHTPKD